MIWKGDSIISHGKTRWGPFIRTKGQWRWSIVTFMLVDVPEWFVKRLSELRGRGSEEGRDRLPARETLTSPSSREENEG